MQTQESSGSTDSSQTVDRVVRTSRTFLDRQADNATNMLAERVSGYAKDLRHAGDQLRENETVGAAAGLADRGADFIENIAAYLRDADGERLLSDAEALAERNPFLAAGGAFLIGLATSRFLKTSSARRYETSRYDATSSYDPASRYGY